MASNVFKVNVYNINDVPVYRNGTPVSTAFPTNGCMFSAAPSGTVSAANVPLYGIITTNPTGLEINPTTYTVVESVTALVALANA